MIRATFIAEPAVFSINPAAEEKAELQFSHTRIVAPADGRRERRILTSRLSSLPASFSLRWFFRDLIIGIALINNCLDHFADVRSQ